MYRPEPLDFVPLWLMFLFTIAVVYGAVELGYWLGRYRRRISEAEKEQTIGPIVGAMMGLLAFMLTFTFSLAAIRFDARRTMVVDEANAVGTTYLRAGLLPDPHRSQVRELLQQYVNVRLEAVRSGDIEYAVAESESLHGQLWPHAEALAKLDPQSEFAALFVESLNEMIDLHSNRLLISVRSRIPIVIWMTLYFVAAFSMIGLGYHAGLTASRRSLAMVVLVVTFSVVIMLIADLDRPREGLIRVSQQALVDLQSSWAR